MGTAAIVVVVVVEGAGAVAVLGVGETKYMDEGVASSDLGAKGLLAGMTPKAVATCARKGARASILSGRRFEKGLVEVEVELDVDVVIDVEVEVNDGVAGRGSAGMEGSGSGETELGTKSIELLLDEAGGGEW